MMKRPGNRYGRAGMQKIQQGELASTSVFVGNLHLTVRLTDGSKMSAEESQQWRDRLRAIGSASTGPTVV